jgi:hypothetical protein
VFGVILLARQCDEFVRWKGKNKEEERRMKIGAQD